MATPHRGAPAYRPDDGASLYNAAQWGTFLPNVGWWAQQPGVLGVVSTASPRQQCYASPFPIGPVGFEVDAFRYRIGTAAAGGANLRAEVGLYRDDGTGFPDADTRLAFAESTDFSAGDRDLTFTPVFLKPGLYWMMWVYSATQSPSTNPAFSCISNASYALPVLNSQPPGSLNRALLVARTTLPTERSQFTRSSVGVTGNNNAPMVMLRRSA